MTNKRVVVSMFGDVVRDINGTCSISKGGVLPEGSVIVAKKAKVKPSVIKQARMGKMISRALLAKKIGILPKDLKAIEEGKLLPRVKHIEELALELEISVHELLLIEESQN